MSIVVGVRLSSQEDIIGQIEEAELNMYNNKVTTRVKVKAPALIGMVPTQSGQAGLALADFLPYASDQKTICLS